MNDKLREKLMDRERKDRDCLLYYILYRIDERCEIKRVDTPDGYCCLVKVDSFQFLFTAADIQTIKELMKSSDWVRELELPARLEECLKTGKEIKKEEGRYE